MQRLSLSGIRRPTLRWAVASALVLSAALAASLWRLDRDREARGLNTSITALRQQLHSASVTAVADVPGPDFSQALPESSTTELVVRELQRSSAEVGAAFVSVSSAPRAATLQALGRTELSITLRGAYPKLKTVLAQTLDRFPNLIVQRLTLRRMVAPADLEAHLDLVLLARPLAASGAGS